MDLSLYRREFGNFHAAAEKNRLEKFLGRAETVSGGEIAERAADLFSGAAIFELEKSLTDATDSTETERRARRNLLGYARRRFLENQAREVAAEYQTCLESGRVAFRGEKLTLSETFEKIAVEENGSVRAELFARLSETRAACADLRLENFKIRRAAAAQIGFEDYEGLFEEIAGMTDFESLKGAGERFLAASEESYFRLHSEIFSGEKTPSPADFYFRRRRLDRREIFDGKKLPGFYRRILENFDFSDRKIPQIEFLEVGDEKRTGLFRPNFPVSEAVFCVSRRGGAAAFSEFFKVFGKAQQAAWTSEDLARRFPEFVFSPDAVASEGYGRLFQLLLTEENFLRRSFGLWDEKLARRVELENRFWRAVEIRRDVLRMLGDSKFNAAVQFASSAETARELADVFARNLGLATSETDVLFELSEDFEPARNVRASLFACGLREYLRARYDFDWWNSRAAFEELIDFWNTAERYSAEEMARMIGFEMDFDILKEL